MSVVFAGNSTLSVKTNVCPMEGCDGPGAEGRTDPAYFYWSNASSWLAQGNTTVPCDHVNPMAPWVDVKGNVGTCADVTIWEVTCVTCRFGDSTNC